MAWRQRAARRAFTLVEIMAVVVIVSILTAIGAGQYREVVERARVAKAIGDLKAIVTDLQGLDSLPASLAAINRATMLDPWGRHYVYFLFPASAGGAPPRGARKDRFLVPINSQFDLYSRGRDGASSAPLTASSSRDDVIVANDGAFIGLAAHY